MYYEKDSRAFNLVVGLALGVAVGAAAVYLTAPRSGRRTRRRLMKGGGGAKGVTGGRWDLLTQDLRGVFNPGRRLSLR